MAASSWTLLLSAAADATSSSAYVVNNTGSVWQFDVGAGGLLSHKMSATVAVGGSPLMIAITPDGKSAYVANTSGSVSQYDVGADGLLSAKTPSTVATMSSADAVAVSPDGKSVYVPDLGNAIFQYDVDAAGRLSPKSPASVPSSEPDSVAVSPDGKSLYVTNLGLHTVSQFDVGPGGTLTPKSAPTVQSDPFPVAVAITPDGKNVYVANNNGVGTVSQYDVGAGEELSPKTKPTVLAGANPMGIAVSPDGKSVYVANAGDNSISQFDVGPGGALSAKTPPSRTEGGQPSNPVVSPDGKSVYVTNSLNSGAGNTVSQYNVGAGGVLSPKTPTTVATSVRPTAVVLLPDQGPAAAFSVSAAPAGSLTSFDGRGSSDSDGTVARYDWNFGDGVALPNAGPTPTHAYASAGNYTVTLTVTDDGGCSTAFVFTGQTAACNGSAAAVTRRMIAVAPAPPRPPPPVVTKLAMLGPPTPSSTGVSFSLVCRAASGTACRVLGQLSTTERLLGRRLLGLTARAKRHRKRIVIGSKRFTIAAGQRTRLVVPLNPAGGRLLTRFRRIPATLSIALLSSSPSAVITANVAITAKHKRKRR
jgi:DNA-binding beta-propeller fold protein YncE